MYLFSILVLCVGVCKAGIVLEHTPLNQNTGWTHCASEGGVCTCAGSVRYGAGYSWTQQSVSTSIGCNNGVFGDPSPGVPKNCECSPWSQSDVTYTYGDIMTWRVGYNYCGSPNFGGASCQPYACWAPGNDYQVDVTLYKDGAALQSVSSGGVSQAYYNYYWSPAHAESGSYTVCANFYKKVGFFCQMTYESTQCSNTITVAGPPAAWNWCANEGGSCTCDGVVRYGAGSSWYSLPVSPSTMCTNGVFGDPLYGTVKHCECQTTCPRIRKNWNKMSDTERDLFLASFKAMRDDLQHDEFAYMHGDNFGEVHANGAFLPWHRHFTLALEDQLRSRPGFECVTVPYWPYDEDSVAPAWRPEVFNYPDFGANGDSIYDVVNDYFDATWRYESTPIHRKPVFPGNTALPQQSVVASIVTTNPDYSDFSRQLYNGHHVGAHGFVGGLQGQHHGPFDPIFWMIHSQVDRMWAIWQDCHGYDDIEKANIGAQIYSPEPTGLDTAMDDELPFNLDMSRNDVTYHPFGSYHPTPRDMHRIQDLGYSYQRGDFEDLAVVTAICSLRQYRVADDPAVVDREVAAPPKDENIKKLYSRLVAQGEDRVTIAETLAKASCELYPQATVEEGSPMWSDEATYCDNLLEREDLDSTIPEEEYPVEEPPYECLVTSCKGCSKTEGCGWFEGVDPVSGEVVTGCMRTGDSEGHGEEAVTLYPALC